MLVIYVFDIILRQFCFYQGCECMVNWFVYWGFLATQFWKL